MPRARENIACPRHPDHGIASKRWLSVEEREILTKTKGDVFAITCAICGEYEWQFASPDGAPDRK
jgi:hypothetical protein